jgi:hypothetical protein
LAASAHLQPITWRDRVANLLWTIVGIPLSPGIFAFQLLGIFWLTVVLTGVSQSLVFDVVSNSHKIEREQSTPVENVV